MIFALQLGEVVFHQVEEGRVGVQDDAVQTELNDRLAAVDGVELARDLCLLLHVSGYVMGDLDDLDHIACGIADRRVA